MLFPLTAPFAPKSKEFSSTPLSFCVTLIDLAFEAEPVTVPVILPSE